MKRLLLLTMALIVLAMPVRAEPGPIGNWLMNEPVTLWDWGMMRMKEAAQEAADHATLNDGGQGGSGAWTKPLRGSSLRIFRHVEYPASG